MRKLAIALGVVLLLLVIADRAAPFVASGVIAGRIQSAGDLNEEPKVSIHGVPFLTQALGGDYENVEVTASGLEVDQLHDVRVNVHFRGLHVPLSDVLRGDVEEAPVDRVNGTATVRYDDLAAASGVEGLTLRRDGDDIRVRATLAAQGQEVTVSARAVVELSDTDLVVRAEDPQVDGQDLPDEVLAAFAQQLSFRQTLEGLPYGLRVTDVTVQDEGLDVAVTAEDLVLRSGSIG